MKKFVAPEIEILEFESEPVMVSVTGNDLNPETNYGDNDLIGFHN